MEKEEFIERARKEGYDEEDIQDWIQGYEDALAGGLTLGPDYYENFFDLPPRIVY